VQSRISSIVEVTLNLASGFVLALGITYFVLPAWGYTVRPDQALQITTLYTVVSWLRSYAWRRIFNHLNKQGQ
jgi:hypothetical protein